MPPIHPLLECYYFIGSYSDILRVTMNWPSAHSVYLRTWHTMFHLCGDAIFYLFNVLVQQLNNLYSFEDY
jgi:hypothetical protein